MLSLGLFSGIWFCRRGVVFSGSVIGSWWWGSVLGRHVVVRTLMGFRIAFWFLFGELGVGGLVVFGVRLYLFLGTIEIVHLIRVSLLASEADS